MNQAFYLEFHSEDGSILSGEFLITSYQATGCQSKDSPEDLWCCSFYVTGLEFIYVTHDISVWRNWLSEVTGGKWSNLHQEFLYLSLFRLFHIFILCHYVKTYFIQIHSYILITLLIYYLCNGHVNVHMILILSPMTDSEYFGKQINNFGSLHVLLCYVMLVSMFYCTINTSNFMFSSCLLLLISQSTDCWLIRRISVLSMSGIIKLCTQLWRHRVRQLELWESEISKPVTVQVWVTTCRSSQHKATEFYNEMTSVDECGTEHTDCGIRVETAFETSAGSSVGKVACVLCGKGNTH